MCIMANNMPLKLIFYSLIAYNSLTNSDKEMRLELMLFLRTTKHHHYITFCYPANIFFHNCFFFSEKYRNWAIYTMPSFIIRIKFPTVLKMCSYSPRIYANDCLTFLKVVDIEGPSRFKLI